MAARIKKTETDEPRLRVVDYVESPIHAVPVSGLLVAKPELLEAELTAEEWQAELDAYLASTPAGTPAHLVPEEPVDEPVEESNEESPEGEESTTDE
jgi:hypothetical protein